MLILKDKNGLSTLNFNILSIPLISASLQSHGNLSSVDRAISLRSRRSACFYRTPFHLVTSSPWPIVLSLAILATLLGVVGYMHDFSSGRFSSRLGLIILLFSAVRWWVDVVYEGTKQGCHTVVVQDGLRLGFILFIFSEIMFFIAFFWAFFHSSLAPTLEVGGGWPPVRCSLFFHHSSESFIDSGASYSAVSGLQLFNPWFVPFLNTLLLLGSGAWLTYVHGIVQLDRPAAFKKFSIAFPALVRRLSTRFLIG